MFDVTFFRDDLVTVIHPKGSRVTKRLLDDPRATFVWGELMSPHFIKKLLGHYTPYAAAELRGGQSLDRFMFEHVGNSSTFSCARTRSCNVSAGVNAVAIRSAITPKYTIIDLIATAFTSTQTQQYRR